MGVKVTISAGAAISNEDESIGTNLSQCITVTESELRSIVTALTLLRGSEQADAVHPLAKLRWLFKELVQRIDK